MISLKPKETIVQNLKDAGCTTQMIEDFMIYFDKNQKEKRNNWHCWLFSAGNC